MKLLQVPLITRASFFVVKQSENRQIGLMAVIQEEAEDLLQEIFIKIMLATFSFAGNGRGMENGSAPQRSRDGSNCGNTVNNQ